MKKVVISTSAVNSYGSRVLTSGIDFEQYTRNPVLLWMHRRGDREDVPIGRMEDIHLEGDKLIGTPVFDRSDEFSDDPSLVLPGQTRMTITRSKLEEVSIVDIGANDDAMAVSLYTAGGEQLTLSQMELASDLPLLTTDPNHSTLNTPNEMNEKIALALGLPAEATDEQAVSAIAHLKAEVDQAKQLKLALINEQLASAVQSGKLPKEQEETYRQIGLTMGAETLRITLSTLSAPQRASSIIRPSAPTEPAKFAKFTDIPTDRLEAFKSENPDEYARLYTDHFGFPPPSLSR